MILTIALGIVLGLMIWNFGAVILAIIGLGFLFALNAIKVIAKAFWIALKSFVKLFSDIGKKDKIAFVAAIFLAFIFWPVTLLLFLVFIFIAITGKNPFPKAKTQKHQIST